MEKKNDREMILPTQLSQKNWLITCNFIRKCV